MRMQTRRRSPFSSSPLSTAKRGLLALSLTLAGMAGAHAQTAPLTAQQQRFREIYKELIEINTTHSVGDNTVAAKAMEKRLVDAGFAPGDIQIFEPFPKKGNLVLRFKGDGSKKPLLLLA
ncbi:MAG: peptidase M20, partial [Variovorax sp.]|nr:peptidase M20 [Variovorax sp.]